MRKITLIFQLVLAGVFLYAGAIKAISSGEFAMAILPFTFFPENFIGLFATVLPLAEIAGAILILLPWTRRCGAALILLLCLAFIGALAWALANDIIVACSCFGKDEEPSAGKMVFAMVRDVVLAAMAIFVMIAPARRSPKAAEPASEV
jgi:uncharacterized membrane protein YphA (DoxX/SURF4 family)